MTTTLYGISNCDTIKKAKKYLNDHQTEFTFHDYRKDGLTEALAKELLALFGWEAVLNKRGTTYRQLSDEQKSNLNEASALQIMLDNPAIIKRPILLTPNHQLIGFKAAEYDAVIAQ